MESPSISARFVQPFAQVLAGYDTYDAASLGRLRAIDPETRIAVRTASELAVDQVRKTGDAHLGLKAARAMTLGRAGALDYAIHSAATVRGAIEVAARYARLYNDALRVRLHERAGRAVVVLDCEAPLPPVVHEFSLGAWYANHFRDSLELGARVECWLSHPKPARTDEHERAFSGARLRFDAPCYAFAFDRGALDAPQPSADAALHAVLSEHVALTHALLASRRTLAARVRAIGLRDLSRGSLSGLAVARELRMSPRTLGRRLEREGTTFSAIVDELRRELALRYVGAHAMTLADVASRVGFAHVEALHRAFRRWTGESPDAYRRARRS